MERARVRWICVSMSRIIRDVSRQDRDGHRAGWLMNILMGVTLLAGVLLLQGCTATADNGGTTTALGQPHSGVEPELEFRPLLALPTINTCSASELSPATSDVAGYISLPPDPQLAGVSTGHAVSTGSCLHVGPAALTSSDFIATAYGPTVAVDGAAVVVTLSSSGRPAFQLLQNECSGDDPRCPPTLDSSGAVVMTFGDEALGGPDHPDLSLAAALADGLQIEPSSKATADRIVASLPH